MLLGVFVHAETLGDFGHFEVAADFSDNFRMALFFIISGYMSYILINKMKTGQFMMRRGMNILIPLIFGLLLLNPITLYLIHLYNFGSAQTDASKVLAAVVNYRSPAEPVMVWHLHLWFLISLAVYTLLTPALIKLANSITWVIENSILRWSAFLQFACLMSVIAATVLLKLMLTSLQALTGPLPWIIDVTLRYLPFYTLGILLSRNSEIRALIIKPSWALGLIVVAAYVAYHLLQDKHPVVGKLSIVVVTAVRFWLCITMLWLGNLFLNIDTKLTRVLSNSIYTVYILHYLLLYIFAICYRELFPPGIAMYPIVVAITIVTGVLFHQLFTERSAVLRFALNGKLKSRAAA